MPVCTALPLLLHCHLLQYLRNFQPLWHFNNYLDDKTNLKHKTTEVRTLNFTKYMLKCTQLKDFILDFPKACPFVHSVLQKLSLPNLRDICPGNFIEKKHELKNSSTQLLILK